MQRRRKKNLVEFKAELVVESRGCKEEAHWWWS